MIRHDDNFDNGEIRLVSADALWTLFVAAIEKSLVILELVAW